jgi:hypothetical protein
MGCKSCGNKAKKAAKVVASVAKDVYLGNYTTVEERQRRLAICRTCTHYDSMLFRCRECKCFLRLKVKFINQHCGLPQAKW